MKEPQKEDFIDKVELDPIDIMEAIPNNEHECFEFDVEDIPKGTSTIRFYQDGDVQFYGEETEKEVFDEEGYKKACEKYEEYLQKQLELIQAKRKDRKNG